MIISIKSNNFNLILPIPLFIVIIILKFIPKDKLNNHEKKIILQILKVVKNNLKNYKGLKIVEIISQTGEHIIIKA